MEYSVAAYYRTIHQNVLRVMIVYEKNICKRVVKNRREKNFKREVLELLKIFCKH